MNEPRLWVTYNLLTEGEVDLIHYLYEMNYDNFKWKVMDLIFESDSLNRSKLRLAFPSQVDAVNRYQNENGYWEGVLIKAEIKKEV